MIRNTMRLCAYLGILAAGMLSPASLMAETNTEMQIRLMSEALQARDAGDLNRARTNLEQLLALNPSDPAIARLLENVNASILAAEATPPPPPPPPQRAGILRRDDPARPLTEAELLIEEERRRMETAMEEARAFQEAANRLAAEGEYRAAIDSMQRAIDPLPVNPVTAPLIDNMERDLANIYHRFARSQLEQGDLEGARESLMQFVELDPAPARAERIRRRMEAEIASPHHIPVEEVSPDFVRDQARVRELLRIGRAQMIHGDLHGAEQSFRQVEAIDGSNAEAKARLRRIAEMHTARSDMDRLATRQQMLQAVGTAWQRPQVFVERIAQPVELPPPGPLYRKLNEIIIPSVNFLDVELSRAIAALAAISEEYDPELIGVNMHVIPEIDRPEPQVTITVRNMTLRRILDLIVDRVRFRYDVEEDVVVIRPGIRPHPGLQTENFPIARPTINRLLGRVRAPEAAPADPFAPPAVGQEIAPADGESRDLQRFFQQTAGVDFTIPGSSLVYDGTDVWVTQTDQNIQRIRNTLRRLTDVRQVEIEAKFLEITESSLDEFGVNWAVLSGSGRGAYETANRSLASAFAGTQVASEVRITDPVLGELSFPAAPPTIPGVVALGAGAPNLAQISGVVDGYEVAATIRALQQRSGVDLLSAPKVTVMSGHQAVINVAQEIRYPDTYGDTEAEVSGGAIVGGVATGGSVAITPGTPQDFQTRLVGVELSVTPTVEHDNSVTLDLHPQVTEFQGFVEYGGMSVAIEGGTVVTNPPGFFQPIFATREVITRVNIWDGATVVLGGLTREEVRRVSDRTPVLGSIPVIGRLFRSEGEASEKRNLLIFVTANLVSPGGSPMHQNLRTVEAGALFQNPTVITPAGAALREKSIEQ